jgi:hypothetical protein
VGFSLYFNKRWNPLTLEGLGMNKWVRSFICAATCKWWNAKLYQLKGWWACRGSKGVGHVLLSWGLYHINARTVLVSLADSQSKIHIFNEILVLNMVPHPHSILWFKWRNVNQNVVVHLKFLTWDVRLNHIQPWPRQMCWISDDLSLLWVWTRRTRHC